MADSLPAGYSERVAGNDADDHPQRQLDLSRRGGPGTFAGTDYQLRAAVLFALKQIAQQLLAPHRTFKIALEGYAVEENYVEKWDYVCHASRLGFEAKSKPTAAEVREWLEQASKSHLPRRLLICGEGGGRVLKDARQLLELRGAASSRGSFERALGLAAAGVQKVVTAVDGDPYEALQGMEIQILPVDHIDEDIAQLAGQLAGENAGALVSGLINSFSAGAGKRRVIELPALITSLGFELEAPSHARLEDLPPELAASLAVLQHLPSGVPLAALAAALRTTPEVLQTELRPLTEAAVVVDDDGAWKVAPLLARIPDSYAGELPRRLLEGLLEWIKANPRAAALDAAVHAAVALASTLADGEPALVARVFPALDKPLKRRGDKRAVFDVAELSIRAARASARGQPSAEAQAIALICGRSWVYQRVGQLAKARADGERSLRIATEFADLTTIAFCHKCLGRLCRMEAEAASASEDRRALLERSKRYLNEAVQRFTALANEHEVGDAYSLLGRTLLRSGKLDAARAAAKDAEDRLGDPLDKDYRDLRILEGELAAAEGDFDGAANLYTEVIDAPVPDRQFSEIRGRALHERGVVREMQRQNAAAVADFQAASETFMKLRESDRAATSLLEAMRLEGRVPTPKEPAVARLLASLDPLALVRTIECHEAELERQARTKLALRGDPPRAHWEEMVKLGKRMAAAEGESW